MYMYSMSPFPLLFYCFSLSLYCVESYSFILFLFSAYIPFLSFSLPLSLPLISDTNVIKNDLTTVEKKVRRARDRGRWREEGGGGGRV